MFENNKLIIGDNVHLKNVKINFKGSDCQLMIGDNVRLSGHVLITGKGKKLLQEKIQLLLVSISWLEKKM